MQSDLPHDLGERLGKLLTMLASPAPGEVMATVEALRRTLDRAGLDLHDLAARLTAPQPVPCRTRGAAMQPTDTARLREMGQWLDRYALDRLTPNQRDFLTKARRLLALGRGLTPKQADYLAGLHAMHGGGDE